MRSKWRSTSQRPNPTKATGSTSVPHPKAVCSQEIQVPVTTLRLVEIKLRIVKPPTSTRKMPIISSLRSREIAGGLGRVIRRAADPPDFALLRLELRLDLRGALVFFVVLVRRRAVVFFVLRVDELWELFLLIQFPANPLPVTGFDYSTYGRMEMRYNIDLPGNCICPS
jgi:hypothetical protein